MTIQGTFKYQHDLLTAMLTAKAASDKSLGDKPGNHSSTSLSTVLTEGSGSDHSLCTETAGPEGIS